jgi:Holliday junction resolvase RusA-like endonuclease
MKCITITLPHPPLPLRPNSRTHWRKKAQSVKAYRQQAKVYAIGALAMQNAPLWEKAKVQVVWRCTKRIHPDPDNIIASLKAAFDGLADAGVVTDDRGLWPERPVIETGAHWPEVVLTVTGETE